jgi:hypothetical protein
MVDKKCSKCSIIKDEIEFRLITMPNKRRAECKQCERACNKAYRIENKDYLSEYKSVQYQLRKGTSIDKETNKRAYERRKRNPVKRLRGIVSKAIRKGIKRGGGSKRKASFLNHVDYTIINLMEYLESQFEDWMIWDNYGTYNRKTWNDNDKSTWTWNIDHIIPQSILPYSNMTDENFKICWALKNLRPYSAKQNMIDGSNRIRHKL